MKIKGGKFLITGGASQVGAHITEQLLAADAREIQARDNPGPDTAAAMHLNSQRALLPDPPKSYNQTMRSIGSDLTDLATKIAADEGIAADHSIAATSGC